MDFDGFEGGEDELVDMDEEGEHEMEEKESDAEKIVPEDPEAQDGSEAKDGEKGKPDASEA